MDKNEYAQYGDIVIEDTGYGFRVIPESMQNDDGGMRWRMLWLWPLKNKKGVYKFIYSFCYYNLFISI